MRRREFIAVLGGAAAMPSPRVRRSACGASASLFLQPRTIRSFTFRLGAFLQGLQQAGWSIGRNIRIDTRWATADGAEVRRHAVELAAQAPEVVLASGGTAVSAMLQASRTVPIVFPHCHRSGRHRLRRKLGAARRQCDRLHEFRIRPGRKMAGAAQEIAPKIKRVGVLRDPTMGTGAMQFAAVQAVAPSLRLEVNPINVRDAAEVERSIAAFAARGDGGLITTANFATVRHRDLIIKLAAQHKLPAIYPYRFFAEAGGLVSYGPDQIDQFRLAAGYVDRILKGEKPADLPVQAPTKFELVINLKTAKALGLDRAAVGARPRRRGDRMSGANSSRRLAAPRQCRSPRARTERARAAHRSYGVIVRRRSGGAAAQRSVPARAAAARLDSRPQRSDRLSLGRHRRCRAQARRGVGRLTPDVILRGSQATAPLLHHPCRLTRPLIRCCASLCRPRTSYPASSSNLIAAGGLT